jgi:hypothetical protein
MNRNIVNWFRWLVVMPASIGLGITYAMYISPALMQGVGKSFEHGSSPLIASMIAILVAYIIAPDYKFKTSLTIAFLWLLVPLAGIIIMIFRIKVNGEEQYLLDGGVALFTTMLGILLGSLITWRLTVKHNKSYEAILKRIENTEGLGGMTVNERLYVTGLYDEFYNVIKTDKARARKILTWVKVDEPSIDNILKSEPSS